MNPDQRARLVELLESLDTDKMGQRAVAARQIADIRAEIGKPWSELLVGNLSGHMADIAANIMAITSEYRQSAIPQPAEERPMAAAIMKVIEQHGGRMNTWQAGFLEDMLDKARRGAMLTRSQTDKLAEVVEELNNPKPKPARRAFGAPV